MDNNSNEFQITYSGLKEYFFKSLQGGPYKMFLIACEIERDYLPLLNGNITYYWTLFKVQHDYWTLFKETPLTQKIYPLLMWQIVVVTKQVINDRLK